MNRWQRLFEGIRTEIKVFIFFSALLTAFRIVFLAVFQSQLASVTMENILTSLWLGFRLSLKTVGSLCLLGFLGGTLVHTFVPKWPSLRIKQVIYSIATVLLTFLFLGRIPFYKIFNSSYNAMLINGKNDDIGAIINTAINEYNALMYIVVILLGTSVGATTSAEAFLNWDTIKIVILGLVAFAFGTAAGVLFGKLMCFATGGKVNPLIGSAGVSAVPMAARVSQKVGAEADPTNFLLMHAMGPNVAGVIGTAVAAGTFMAIFGVK